MPYKHTQIGKLIIIVLLLIILDFGFIFKYAGAELNSTIIFLMSLVLFIIFSFTTLNVMINKNYLKIKFGYGIFRKKFSLQEITSAKAVKNHWYYGWGIRWWLWPKMWIYNVSGFDAVEIKMKNNKIFRIGTDEPQVLESAIKQAIK